MCNIYKYVDRYAIYIIIYVSVWVYCRNIALNISASGFKDVVTF